MWTRLEDTAGDTDTDTPSPDDCRDTKHTYSEALTHRKDLILDISENHSNLSSE